MNNNDRKVPPQAASAVTSVREPRWVSVEAPGRLHLGFLDPAATLGRRFGSLGVVLDGWATEVAMSASVAAQGLDQWSVGGPAAQAEVARAQAYLQALKAHTGRFQALHVRLSRVLPAHAGLGSGTQLALAVARAFAAWHGLEISTPRLAEVLGRGQRSGIGIAGFDQGGLLLDGGPGPQGQAAPVLSRVQWPAAWRVLLVLDPARRGLSGDEEREAIARLSPVPQATAADLCHRVLMQVLPAAAQGDFPAFAQGLSHLQSVMGAHFAPAQAGRAYSSPAVARCMDWVAHYCGPQGAGVGQSSWGPTAFAVLPSEAVAQQLIAALKASGTLAGGLQLSIVSARRSGAAVHDSVSVMPASRLPVDADHLWRWQSSSAQAGAAPARSAH